MSIATLRMPPWGWRLELEVEKGTTVGEVRKLLAGLADGPKITPKTKILNTTLAGQIYTLKDEEKATKKMLLMDASQEVQEPPQEPAQAVAAPAPQSVQPQQLAPAPPAARPGGEAQGPFDGSRQAEAQGREQREAPRPSPTAGAAEGAATGAARRAAGASSGVGRQLGPVGRPPGGGGGSRMPFDEALRNKLLRRLAPQWSCGDRAPGGAQQQRSAGAELARDLAQALMAVEAGEVPCLVQVVSAVFGQINDMLHLHASGAPLINETLLVMANNYYKLCRPVLLRHGLNESVAGLARMDQLLFSQIELPEVAQVLASNICTLCFGKGDGTPVETYITQIILMSVSSQQCPAIASFASYLQHLACPPLDRRSKSAARTMAWVELLLQPCLQAMRSGGPEWRAAARRRVMWILGATDAEAQLAQEGVFEDVRCLKDGEVEVYLIGHDLKFKGPCGAGVKVSGYTWDELKEGKVPDALFMFCLNTGVGTLEREELGTWLPIFRLLLTKAAIVVTTCRCQVEARAEAALLMGLGARQCLPSTQQHEHVRNLYSSMAANPDVQYDDNGWFMAYVGTPGNKQLLEIPEADLLSRVQEMISAARSVNASIGAALGGDVGDPAVERKDMADERQHRDGGMEAPRMERKSKSPVVFWGILDLKYDRTAPLRGRLKVLETGDGRSSKFSGYGAAIKDNFEQDHKLEEAIRCSVLTENKKLTHDTIVECGYAHIRPRQLFFPKVYSPQLAARIQAGLGLADTGACVLKLCNRTRGAGVVPVTVAGLDATLLELLQPPSNLQAWLGRQSMDWVRTVASGSLEEQARHWWSNECPIFLVEELCCSAPTLRDGKDFDGTMRVGFSLRKEEKDRLPPGWVNTEDGPVYVAELENGHGGALPTGSQALSQLQQEAQPKPWDDDRPYLDLFRSGEVALRLEWLGGYWKLPAEDMNSSDLRGKVVSVAKQGTAPVQAGQLHDVYVSLGNMVCMLFNTNSHNLSHTSLTRKYSECPEFAAFVSSRLACSMRLRDKQKSLQLLELAQLQISKLPSSPPRDQVASYIQRNRGVYEAMHSRWKVAEASLLRSLEVMPANATTRFLLGMAKLDGGNTRAAITSFEEALVLDPDFKAPYMNLGVCWLREAEYEKAREVCEAGLVRHPQTLQGLYNLGVASFALLVVRSRTGAPLVNIDKDGWVLIHSESMGLEKLPQPKASVAHDLEPPAELEPGLALALRPWEALRAAALAALEAARDARGKEQHWSELDDEMVAALRHGTGPVAWQRELPQDGWRLFSWRP